jgi:hypothetical protein
MNELGDPAAMWKTLEDTYSSKTGTSILTILNGVVTKKTRPHMSTNIGHLDSLFYQLTNIQGSDEVNENGLKKDLTITGDIFKICMLLASITEVGEYDAVTEDIRGVSDEGGATSYRAVKNRLLESYHEKHPGSRQFLTTNEITIMVEITGMDSQSELRLQKMTRATSRVITTTKSFTMQMSVDRNKRERKKQ